MHLIRAESDGIFLGILCLIEILSMMLAMARQMFVHDISSALKLALGTYKPYE